MWCGLFSQMNCFIEIRTHIYMDTYTRKQNKHKQTQSVLEDELLLFTQHTFPKQPHVNKHPNKCRHIRNTYRHILIHILTSIMLRGGSWKMSRVREMKKRNRWSLIDKMFDREFLIETNIKSHIKHIEKRRDSSTPPLKGCTRAVQRPSKLWRKEETLIRSSAFVRASAGCSAVGMYCSTMSPLATWSLMR